MLLNTEELLAAITAIPDDARMNTSIYSDVLSGLAETLVEQPIELVPAGAGNGNALLEVVDLKTYFPVKRGLLKIINRSIVQLIAI